MDGFQSTNTKGWGVNSVNTMIKHWPGGGTGEGGRDGHYGFGSYAVYPGDNIEEHMKIFTEGALNLRGNTLSASAIMPYYTIALGNGEGVGSAYNNYLINNILRDKYQYEKLCNIINNNMDRKYSKNIKKSGKIVVTKGNLNWERLR